jgi:oligoribonuclease
MTGLDLTRDALIEIAVLVTDKDLNVVGEGIDLIIKPPDEALEHMSEVVTEMHTKSGLLDALPDGLTLNEAEAAVLDYVRGVVPEERKAPLAGNTIGTDRAFIQRDMPGFDGFLHYRNVDVSSIKELARRWYPRIAYNAPSKKGGHRALADIQESIDELRYYRQTLFVDPPGPRKSLLAKTAALYSGDFSATSPGLS